MIRRPPRSTPLYSSAASDVYKRQLVGLRIGYRDDLGAGDHQRLELLRAEHGAEAEAAEVAIRLGSDAGIGDHLFAGAADAHDGTYPGAGLVVADDTTHREEARHAPHGVGVAEEDLVSVNRDPHRARAGPGDDDGAEPRGADGDSAPPPAVALAEVPGVR